MTAANLLIGVAQLTTMAPVVGFMVAYGFGSPWRATTTGRALMTAVAMLQMLLVLGAARSFFGDSMLIEAARFAAFGVLSAAMWALFVRLRRVQRGVRSGDREEPGV